MKKLLLIVIFLLIPHKAYAVTYAPVDITKLNIMQLQDAVDKGYLNYELITKLYLERISTYDDKYNAIININDDAMEEAKAKDKYYKEHGRTSLLFGIPIIVKDNIDVLGMPTTLGTKSLSDNYPKSDAEIIKNLKEKGAIILAKSNMSEFAFLASSSTSSYGTVKNAYNINYSSYGSSGGSAVSVSLKYAPVAIGTDTNSSLRAPSQAASVIGFRPTLNKLSMEGIINYDMTRDVVGPITTNIYDSAVIMASLENKEEDLYLENMENALVSNIKIGVIDDFLYGNYSYIYGTGKTYDKLITLFENNLKKLEENGVTVIHLKDFYKQKYANIEDATTGGWTMCYSFNKYIKNTTSEIRSFEDLTIDYGHIYSLYEYLDECERDIDEINGYEKKKADYRTYVDDIYEKYDLDALVYPTTKNRLSRIGEGNFESPSYAIAPVLGYPAVSMPLGFIDGLPYGMEFVSTKNNEQRLYEILSYYEKINKVYKLSSLAKNLYEIPESVDNLKNLYETALEQEILYLIPTKNGRNYKESVVSISEFFENYSSYNDFKTIDELALQLSRNYNEALNNLKIGNEKQVKKNKIDKLIILLLKVLVITILIIIFLKLVQLFRRKTNKKRRL